MVFKNTIQIKKITTSISGFKPIHSFGSALFWELCADHPALRLFVSPFCLFEKNNVP